MAGRGRRRPEEAGGGRNLAGGEFGEADGQEDGGEGPGKADETDEDDEDDEDGEDGEDGDNCAEEGKGDFDHEDAAFGGPEDFGVDAEKGFTGMGDDFIDVSRMLIPGGLQLLP